MKDPAEKVGKRTLVSAFRGASPVVKVAVTWGFWATVCLTTYYFSRRWAGNQRVENLKIRQTFNDEFSEKLEQARLNMDEDKDKK